MEILRSWKAKGVLLVACMASFALAIAGTAMAEPPEYSKLTDGVKTEFGVIVPIVLAALGLIIGIAFAIRWGVRKFGGVR
jgi:hypothetical protein